MESIEYTYSTEDETPGAYIIDGPIYLEFLRAKSIEDLLKINERWGEKLVPLDYLDGLAFHRYCHKKSDYIKYLFAFPEGKYRKQAMYRIERYHERKLYIAYGIIAFLILAIIIMVILFCIR